jgi:uncharacterized protein (TIGR02444 family)
MSQEHVVVSLTLERLWQFSLRYYSVREVKDACLTLQNSYHGNVNLLLLLKWLDEQQISIHENDWDNVVNSTIRSNVLINSYREYRRKLKFHLPDTLYREALQFELLLEKQQQSDIVECINSINLLNQQTMPLTFKYCKQLGAEHLYCAFSSSSISSR